MCSNHARLSKLDEANDLLDPQQALPRYHKLSPADSTQDGPHLASIAKRLVLWHFWISSCSGMSAVCKADSGKMNTSAGACHVSGF